MDEGREKGEKEDKTREEGRKEDSGALGERL